MKTIRFNHVYHSWAAACLICGASLMGSAVADSPTDGADESAAAVVAESEASKPTTHANWVTSMERAQELARDKRKAILMDFTGSDWCGWCIKLSEEVFDTPEFKEWADQHLVLVELDFPNDQSKITPEIKAHNDQWLKKLQVAGFPTVYLTDHEGRPFAKTGYKAGGPDEYIKHLKQQLQVRMLRDTAIELANEAEGSEKARFLDEALSTMDGQIVGLHYTEEIEKVKELGGEVMLKKYEQLAGVAEGGAESAGMVREDWMADPFGFLGADMQDASDHLDIVDTEPPVEEYHPRIEDRLAKLIELMNKT